MERSTARTAGSETIATAQKADRHPQRSPSTAPAGTPTTQAIVTPPTTTAVARPFSRSGTIETAVVSATAQKPALARAPTKRVARSTP